MSTMVRNRVCALLFRMLVSASVSGQVAMNFSPSGPSVTTPGAAFRAERITRAVQHLAEGTTLIREEQETLSRDSVGRFLDESHPSPSAQSSSTGKVTYLLIDPVKQQAVQWIAGAPTGISFPLISNSHLTVVALPIPRNAGPQIPKDKTVVTTESLGTKTFAGIAAAGVRTLTVIPANLIGNGAALTIRHDVWTSTELQIVVAEDDESPFTGTRHSEIVSMKRGDPAPDLFTLPRGLTVKETASPTGLPNSQYARLLQQVVAEETREQASTELVAYAKVHPEVQNHVAHVLAARNTHLDDAETLAQVSIDRIERQSTAVSGAKIIVDDMRRMELLAEYWDTLGWVRYAKGDLVGARRYCQDAWEVGGEGLYLSHIARLDEESGDKSTAAHLLQVAMSGKMDDREQVQVKSRAVRLGVAEPRAIQEPTQVTVARKNNAIGTSTVFLIFVKGEAPRVQWLSNETRMADETEALKEAQYPEQMPDSGEAYVVREGKLECLETGCRMRLMYAWESIKDISGL
jgi:hypothetical protein